MSTVRISPIIALLATIFLVVPPANAAESAPSTPVVSGRVTLPTGVSPADIHVRAESIDGGTYSGALKEAGDGSVTYSVEIQEVGTYWLHFWGTGVVEHWFGKSYYYDAGPDENALVIDSLDPRVFTVDTTLHRPSIISGRVAIPAGVSADDVLVCLQRWYAGSTDAEEEPPGWYALRDDMKYSSIRDEPSCRFDVTDDGDGFATYSRLWQQDPRTDQTGTFRILVSDSRGRFAVTSIGSDSSNASSVPNADAFIISDLTFAHHRMPDIAPGLLPEIRGTVSGRWPTLGGDSGSDYCEVTLQAWRADEQTWANPEPAGLESIGWWDPAKAFLDGWTMNADATIHAPYSVHVSKPGTHRLLLWCQQWGDPAPLAAIGSDDTGESSPPNVDALRYDSLPPVTQIDIQAPGDTDSSIVSGSFTVAHATSASYVGVEAQKWEWDSYEQQWGWDETRSGSIWWKSTDSGTFGVRIDDAGVYRLCFSGDAIIDQCIGGDDSPDDHAWHFTTENWPERLTTQVDLSLAPTLTARLHLPAGVSVDDVKVNAGFYTDNDGNGMWSNGTPDWKEDQRPTPGATPDLATVTFPVKTPGTYRVCVAGLSIITTCVGAAPDDGAPTAQAVTFTDLTFRDEAVDIQLATAPTISGDVVPLAGVTAGEHSVCLEQWLPGTDGGGRWSDKRRWSAGEECEADVSATAAGRVHYRVFAHEPGTYRVCVSSPGAWRSCVGGDASGPDAEAVVITVLESSVLNLRDIVMVAAPQVGGSVFATGFSNGYAYLERWSGDGIWEHRDTEAYSQWLDFTYSNPGRFTFRPSIAGTYRICFAHSGNASTPVYLECIGGSVEGPDAEAIQVNGPQAPPLDITATLAPLPQVSGKVSPEVLSRWPMASWSKVRAYIPCENKWTTRMCEDTGGDWISAYSEIDPASGEYAIAVPAGPVKLVLDLSCESYYEYGDDGGSDSCGGFDDWWSSVPHAYGGGWDQADAAEILVPVEGRRGLDFTFAAQAPPAAPENAHIARVGDGWAEVQWDEPADNGGAPVNEYSVTAVNWATGEAAGTCVAPADARSCRVEGLVNYVQYRFQVVAMSAAGLTSDPAYTGIGITHETGLQVWLPRPNAVAGEVVHVWILGAEGVNAVTVRIGAETFTADVDSSGIAVVARYPDESTLGVRLGRIRVTASATRLADDGTRERLRASAVQYFPKVTMMKKWREGRQVVVRIRSAAPGTHLTMLLQGLSADGDVLCVETADERGMARCAFEAPGPGEYSVTTYVDSPVGGPLEISQAGEVLAWGRR